MIVYHPLELDIVQKPLKFRPNTCFIMTQLGKPVPREIIEIIDSIKTTLKPYKCKMIDANSSVTGRDYLLKIWEVILSVPLGIAVLSGDMKITTLENIFYEIGLMQAMGKNTIVIKTKDIEVPSDFVRTEYIEYEDGRLRKNKLTIKLKQFLNSHYELSKYFFRLGENLHKDNTAALDYFMRSYLIKPKESIRKKIRELISDNTANQMFKERAKEMINYR